MPYSHSSVVPGTGSVCLCAPGRQVVQTSALEILPRPRQHAAVSRACQRIRRCHDLSERLRSRPAPACPRPHPPAVAAAADGESDLSRSGRRWATTPAKTDGISLVSCALSASAMAQQGIFSSRGTARRCSSAFRCARRLAGARRPSLLGG